jgi:hypothetical protein
MWSEDRKVMTAGTQWNPAVGATPDTLRNDGFRPFIVFKNRSC